ncbi:MAG: glycosyl hydrolase family 39 [Acidobacteria bacterium]|nr:glycosyl hydrolase family 39 [Acidobacteriota bacterium]
MKRARREVLRSSVRLLLILCLLAIPAGGQAPAATETVEIDLGLKPRPFPHYWEQVFGSGRAILTLRESYRRDLRQVQAVTELKYVRFHAIFHDDVGIYDEDSAGNPVYNFSYLDQIYDGLLANGVRPFIELSFMPKKLAATTVQHSFWYKQYTGPPKDWRRWEDLVFQFTKHLVERYGVAEAAQWYFEVWNEPNIDFWSGEPKFETYVKLYEHAARGIKRVDGRLRVGGPGTAQAAWSGRFIRHCVENSLPIDFVSTHVYANDTADNVFGTNEKIPRTDMVCRAARKVYDEVKASPLPDLPIHWTEYNASYMNEPPVTDTLFMGPWLANTIARCDGLMDTLAYWTFSDVFEEQGVVKTPFYGGFGLIAAGGLPKPSFNAFKLLHLLGDRRIPVNSDSILVTRRSDGTWVLAVWNLFLPEDAGTAKEVILRLRGLQGMRRASIHRLDAEHGSVHPVYDSMNRPRYPTAAQIQQMQKAAELPPPERQRIHGNELKLTIPPHGLVVIEIR